MPSIDQPLTLPNGVVLANRIVKSGLSEALADVRNNPTDDLINLFATWSTSGAALLITGHTSVDRAHLEHARNAVIDLESDLPRFQALARAAQRGGAKALMQIAHAGRQSPQSIIPNPLSISDVKLDVAGYGQPVAATEEELTQVIGHFTRSALLAQAAGFDGVEIHCAHGYLLSSALSPRINTRTDRWGGSLVNRARLVLEIVKAVRAAVKPEFIVAIKMNSSDFQQGGFDHEDSAKVALMLEGEGIDFIEISGGNFETPVAYAHQSKKQSTRAREGYFLEYAAAMKASLRIPLMVTGGFRSASVMNDAIASKQTDLIGMGRPFIIDPTFPAQLLSGAIDMAPAVEREFPPADALPRGAVLNWFCAQLAILGEKGQPDLTLPVVAGHEKYLANIEHATAMLLHHRNRNAAPSAQ